MDKFLTFLKTLFEKKYKGAAIDTRPQVEKNKIYYHEEFATGAQYSKFGTKEDAYKIAKKYPKENQWATSSCMAHMVALALGIDNELEGHNFVRLSQALLYRKRANYPAEGMLLDDVFEIARKIGTCHYELLPTPKTEYEINNVKISQAMLNIAHQYRASNHVNVKNYWDFEVLNSIASQGKPVGIMIYATRREWAQEYPKIMDNVSLTQAPIRHGVTILPNSGFIENGKKYFIVQESYLEWGDFHCLDEAWIKQRCYGAAYPLNLENELPNFNRPKHTFSQNMGPGNDNAEVKALQKCLQYLGFFTAPSTTGYFGGITLKAVKDFQEAYRAEILTPNGLSVGTGVVGPSTIKKLNELFAN